MLQKIEYRDIEIETERDFFSEGEGKILKIYAELEEGVELRIITKENEELLNIVESGTYYPRSNISSQKDVDNPLGGEVQEQDYFYFVEGLLIEISSETSEKRIGIKNLRIIFDDMKSL